MINKSRGAGETQRNMVCHPIHMYPELKIL